MKSCLSFPVTPEDYRLTAQARLPRFLFDYLDGGATNEQTLKANTQDWHQIRLRQRVLKNVEQIDTSCQLAGQSYAMPLGLAPVGLAGMMATRGEVQAAQAALTANLPFTLSTVGICSMEEVKAATGVAPWFQLYMLRDRALVKALLERIWSLGCQTLIFTIDLPQPGIRHRDFRNGLNRPGFKARLIKAQQLLSSPGWLWRVGLRGGPLTFGNLSKALPDAKDMNAFMAWIENQFDPSVTWDDLHWLRQHWPGKLLLKGILDEEDAQQAVAIGAEGILVSNHGGRQLDGVASVASKLPRIAEVVGQQTEILVDGGIRSGVDIFRALALGASGALIGRPWAWALAAANQTGVEQLLYGWQQELKLAMTLTGVTRIADISPEQLDTWTSQLTSKPGE